MLHSWLQDLTTESTLADLATHAFKVSPLTSGNEVALELTQKPELPGVLVCEGDELKNVISRTMFFQRLSRRYSREIYLTRPIQVFLDDRLPPPLCLNSSERIGAAAVFALDRPPAEAYEPVVVLYADHRIGLLDVYVLLRAQAHLLAMAQVAMVQNEKLASLGQLAAGVAHEINNPLAFVSNNLSVLQRDAKALIEALAEYRKAGDAIREFEPQLYDRITELDDRVDLDYTAANLPDIVNRSKDGLRRIQQIVKDLREFARLDMGDVTEVDVNEGLASTANILLGRAKGAEVRVELDLHDVPLLSANAGKLNQVFMNLLANAVDASRAGGVVTVRTRHAHNLVIVEVEDTGGGIDPAIQQKIFDPFFTTKPPGHGTGLGLSISYGIVRDHGGTIDVQSNPGEGSLFRVTLPVPTGLADLHSPASRASAPISAVP